MEKLEGADDDDDFDDDDDWSGPEMFMNDDVVYTL